jgi:hypothetical protein
MKRRERQGRRQPEEAQILVGWKAPPDTPTPLPSLKPRSPRPGLFLCSLLEAAIANYPGQRFTLRNGALVIGNPSDPSCAQPRVGQDFPPFFVITSKLGMSDDHEVSLMRMDVAFCARLLAAIEAGLENAPIGVVTTPGTESPKYVKAEPRLPASSLGDF